MVVSPVARMASQDFPADLAEPSLSPASLALAPSTVRPLARGPRVLIGWPLPLGFGLDGRLLLAFWGGLLRKTHTQVIEYPHMRLPLTGLIYL